MLILLVIGFIALEILGFYLFVDSFGALWLLLEILLSGIFGAWLLLYKNIGFFSTIFMRIAESGMFNGKKIIDLIFSFYAGAFFLMIPGIFSDVAGIILIIISLFSNTGSVKDSQFTQILKENENLKNIDEADIIDVEIIEEKVKK